ncbi:oxidoreductase component of anaerobic dehydrogenases [Vibrio sp. JCM 19236]|nr:oxidoreductase component of anaerobic dehydrogenases [Vibrio sp. JCM 19236]
MIINSKDPAKILGVLFYQWQSKAETKSLVSALALEHVLSYECESALISDSEESLNHEFQTLFSGIGTMPAPPWGSVYLDKDRVIFGHSTVDYRQFLHRHDVDMDTGTREPEDQFGLMLMAYSYLLEMNKVKAAIELLEKHLLPWAIDYLELLSNSTDIKYFKLLALETNNWLKALIDENQLEVEQKKLYLDARVH